MKNISILFLFFCLICFAHYAEVVTASTTTSVHNFTTGVMHDAKDVYRANGRSVENDLASAEVAIATGGGGADSIARASIASHTAETGVNDVHGASSDNFPNAIVRRNAGGYFSGTLDGNVSGNATTASRLATARTINGVPFDGSANIDFSSGVPATTEAMISSLEVQVSKMNPATGFSNNYYFGFDSGGIKGYWPLPTTGPTYTAGGSVDIIENTILLEGETTGSVTIYPNTYYGTNGLSVKGWWDFPTGSVYLGSGRIQLSGQTFALEGDVENPASRTVYGKNKYGTVGWYDPLEFFCQQSVAKTGGSGSDLYFHLVNDSTTPGANKLYGTDASGVKGWFSRLVNDNAAPGANKLYGTDASGVKGWYDQPAGGGSTSAVVSEWVDLQMPIYRTDNDTFTILDNATSQVYIKAGNPIKYNGYYAIINAVTDGGTTLSVDLCGAPLTTSLNSGLTYVGFTSKVRQLNFAITGYFADAADNTLIANDLLSAYKWDMPKAYLAKTSVKARVADSGASNSRINVTLGTTDVLTANSNAGLTVSTSWANNTSDINTSNYDVNFGDTVEIKTDANGSNDNAQDLTVQMTFVLE